ncbi:6-carboxytetrahydropterin synthase QueD [Pelosinus sp. IPA-1]|uniref:6-carboxytetrahydropterin synthase QueD n=1 Tax=Pelosinus sp. IPA-1 TaxID=3029569 RepID=UPI00243626D8|nr:6-carboxytetrahydropterin synthase QueD [Pelosinus sp. IPA-1]GMA99615.1 6-carboxy-5,6,7,8-tetrahydropterin synthase [Pelosinus sp. IPA-1]
MFELTIAVNFEAAHCIRNYPGKCSRIHGHNWKVEVNIYGSKLDELGMLIDFGDLKAAVNDIMVNLDHYYLNEIEPFCRINPTAENLAQYIYEKLAETAVFNQDVKLRSVRVWESPNSAAAYSQEA